MTYIPPSTFTDRLDKFTARAAGLDLAPTISRAFFDADEKVHRAVDEFRAGCPDRADVYGPVARKVVDGKLTPAKALDAVSSRAVFTRAGNAPSIFDTLAAQIAATVRNDLDDDALSLDALKADVLEQWQDDLPRRAQRYVDAVKNAPAAVKKAMSGTRPGERTWKTLYGLSPLALQKGGFDLLGPVETVKGDALDAMRELLAAQSALYGPANSPGDRRVFESLAYVCDQNERWEKFAAAKTSHPFGPWLNLLLLGGDDVEYLATDMHDLGYLVASGKVTDLDVITRPLDDDHDEFARRAAAVGYLKAWARATGRVKGVVEQNVRLDEYTVTADDLDEYREGRAGARSVVDDLARDDEGQA